MTTALAAASTQLALMPDFLDPMKLLGYFGTWALVGLLVVIFVESGLLFPVLPGDSLLFVGGMLAAGTAAIAKEGGQTVNFQLWQLLVFIPIAAILGGQVGYWIGRNVGTAMFKPDARLLKQKYLDEAHVFFEQRGPFAIVIARFVPIVRTLAPLVAGAARMSYPVFAIFNILGAVVWGVGLVLLGYWLGQFEIIQKLLEPIFIAIVRRVHRPDVHRVVQAAPGGQEGRGRDGSEPDRAADLGSFPLQRPDQAGRIPRPPVPLAVDEERRRRVEVHHLGVLRVVLHAVQHLRRMHTHVVVELLDIEPDRVGVAIDVRPLQVVLVIEQLHPHLEVLALQRGRLGGPCCIDGARVHPLQG